MGVSLGTKIIFTSKYLKNLFLWSNEIMKLGEILEWLSVPPFSKGISLEGKLVVLVSLS